MKGVIYAAASAARWHREHQDRRERWQTAAWGLGTVAVLALGIGLGSMAGAPDEFQHAAASVTGFGLLLLAVAVLCWRRSWRTPPPSTPRYDPEHTVWLDPGRRR